MSASEYSMSSPRKGDKGGMDKSITYDEEFEKFLNDTTESDISNKFKARGAKQESSTPWWMKEDEEKGKEGGSTSASKSFMKQPKPKQMLENQIETNEPAEVTSSKKITTFQLEEMDPKRFSEEFEELPKLNIDQSTLSSYRNDSIQKSQDLPEDYDQEFNEEDSSEQASSSRRSQVSVIHQNTISLQPVKKQSLATTTTLNDPAKAANLLSKVMFLDTVENANQTLHPIIAEEPSAHNEKIAEEPSAHNEEQDQNKQPQSSHQSRLNTQTRRDLADLEYVYRNLTTLTGSDLNSLIKTTSANSEQHRETADVTSKRAQPPNQSFQSFDGVRRLENEFSMTGESNFGLQTIHAIRTELENRALEQILKELGGNQAKISLNKNKTSVRSASSNSNPNADKKSTSKFTNPVDKVVTLRKQAEISNRLSQSAKSRNGKSSSASHSRENLKGDEGEDENKTDWPPKKYQHIRSTGYGTSWKPQTVKKNLLFDLNKSNERLNTSASRSRSETRVFKRNFLSSDNTIINNLNVGTRSPSDLNIHTIKNERKSNIEIEQLKEQLFKASDDYEEKIKDIHLHYESKLNQLNSTINDLKGELSAKNDLESPIRLSSFDNKDKINTLGVVNKDAKELIAKLEKDLNDQDKLIKGYQNENEIIYAELKLLKELRQKESSKFEGEKNQLKLNSIQEKLTNNKLLRSANNEKPMTSVANGSKTPSEKNIVLPVAAETEAAQKERENRLNFFVDKNHELESINKNLTEIINYYEKNQRQIEIDVRIIEEKNGEIKRLNEKVKHLEQGRVAPDSMKEMKHLKNQLKEMDLVIKRLRKFSSSSTATTNLNAQNGVNLSIEYYEKRIEELEKKLKDKSYEVERLNRMWKQKFYMLNEYKNFGKMSDFEKAADGYINKNEVEHDLERNYVYRIKTLEDLIMKLKKDNETLSKKSEKRVKIENIRKSYDANDFREAEYETKTKPATATENPALLFDSGFTRNVLEEVEETKILLSNAHKEIKINRHEYNIQINRIKNSYEKNIQELKEKHRYEVDKLIKLLMIDKRNSCSQIEEDSNESEFLKFNELQNLHRDTSSNAVNRMSSVLDDPAYMRLLLKASENFRDKNVATLMEENRMLSEKLSELKMLRGNDKFLEDANFGLKKRVAELEFELCKAKQKPTSRDFDSVNEKVSTIECKYAQREREIGELMNATMVRNNCDESSSSLNGRHLTTNLSEENQTKRLVSFYENQLKIKNVEIEKFKCELNSMLRLLYTLQN